MRKLVNQTKNITIAEKVIEADSIGTRMVGLMFKDSFPENQTLWISQCNWIHTFFCRFPLDVVFVDKKLVVKGIKRQLKPWRLPGPVFSANSVFELTAGQVATNQIEIGDQLYVGN